MIRSTVQYAALGFFFVAATTLLLWPWMDEPARRGVLAAGVVAWPTQVVAFGLLVWSRERLSSFLVVWIGGTLIRIVIIAIAAFVLTRLTEVGNAPTLLGLAGFFFGLLLLEPLIFKR